jgi:hypothetical protein
METILPYIKYVALAYVSYAALGLITVGFMLRMLGSRREGFIEAVKIKGMIVMIHTWPYGLFETYRTRRAFKSFMKKLNEMTDVTNKEVS